MSLSDARRVLQWNVVMEALRAADVDADTIAMVEQSRNAGEVVNAMARMLLGGADQKAAKNYVKFEMVGLIAPFERAYVELVRPDGQTSHELRELLRYRLEFVRMVLAERPADLELEAFRSGVIAKINEDLAKEAP